MDLPDSEGAQHYALRRLEADLSPALVYHSVWHTREDIVPATLRMAEAEGIVGTDLLLLRVAAYYHDIGFVVQRDGHELAGVRVATEVLPSFGFGPAQIASIASIIMATKLPQSPRDRLGAILADADLDVLGRADFMARNAQLRVELAQFDEAVADARWYTSQLGFLRAHTYFTASARAARCEGKARNARALERLLESAR